MTSHTNLARIGIILLFAITFLIIGTTAPMLYASYAPSDEIIEENEFTAQNTSTNSDQHYICFDRTVHHETSGIVFTELYLVDGADQRVEVGSETMSRYFQDGRETIVTPMELPDNLKEGTYRYLLVIEADLANGRVTRDFTFTSEKFTISSGESADETRPKTC